MNSEKTKAMYFLGKRPLRARKTTMIWKMVIKRINIIHFGKLGMMYVLRQIFFIIGSEHLWGIAMKRKIETKWVMSTYF